MKCKGFSFKLKKEKDLYVPGSILESNGKSLFSAAGDKWCKALSDRLCSPCAENRVWGNILMSTQMSEQICLDQDAFCAVKWVIFWYQRWFCSYTHDTEQESQTNWQSNISGHGAEKAKFMHIL